MPPKLIKPSYHHRYVNPSIRTGHVEADHRVTRVGLNPVPLIGMPGTGIPVLKK